MMNGLQSLPQWQTFMNHPTGAWLGFINAINAVGGLTAFPIAAFVADHYGRKPCLYTGFVFMILGAGLQTGATGQGMFIAARCFVGVSSSWFAYSSVLVTELAYPSHRAIVTALYNCQFNVGALISAWTTYSVRNYPTSWAWRVPSLLQLGIPALAALGTLMCPESPRWLISKGRKEAAKAVLIKYHGGGDPNSALVMFEMEEIAKTLALEREAKSSASYLDMFKTKGNRHRLFITVTLGIFSQWVGK
jgi:MFS family permease